MHEINGDLIALAQNGAFDAIIHGCNCFNTMGSGVAFAIRKSFPQAYQADQKTKSGDPKKLGTCTFVNAVARNGAPFVIYNAYTQYRYGVKDGPHFNMDAFKQCLRFLDLHIPTGARIGMPRIGAGLGGGRWEEIAPVIDDVFAGRDVKVVVL